MIAHWIVQHGFDCMLCCLRYREAGSLLETWILMELADRGSLSDALRGGRFPIHDFTAIYRCLLDIASGTPSTFVSSYNQVWVQDKRAHMWNLAVSTL